MKAFLLALTLLSFAPSTYAAHCSARNNIQMGTVNAGKFHFDAADKDWSLLTGFGMRSYIKHVSFTCPLESVPQVTVSLKSFDVSTVQNPRLAVEAHNITREGFDLSVITWWDTEVYGAGVNWIALVD